MVLWLQYADDFCHVTKLTLLLFFQEGGKVRQRWKDIYRTAENVSEPRSLWGKKLATGKKKKKNHECQKFWMAPNPGIAQ
jgi:hypothetical protein